MSLSACGGDGATVAATKHGDDDKGGAGKSSGSSNRDGGIPLFTRDASAPIMRDGGADETDSGMMMMTTPVPTAAAGAPVVEILEPTTITDPNHGSVVITSTLTVRCRATKSAEAGARTVNKSSVHIFLNDPSGVTKPKQGTVTAAGGDEFTADFDLSGALNGPLQFACEASDSGKPALTGRTTMDTFLDLGPTIEMIEPQNGGAYQLTAAVPIRFRVTNAPVALDDTQAGVTGLHLVVSGQEYDFDQDPQDKSLYLLDVDFGDTTRFPMAPETAEITVTASSSRTPMAPERRVRTDITIDAEGPTIVLKSPADQAIVRGQVALQIQVTDPSGVQRSSVVGTIPLDSGAFVLNEWVVTGSTYVETFDTRSFDPQLTQLTINITATDGVGNEVTAPATFVLRLDNVPPLVSLDPPLIREWHTAGGKTYCSAAFDPVGAKATNDKQSVTIQSMYRAMIWERTNHPPGELLGYVAGMDDSTVKLYAQPDPSVPLLIDTDSDPGHVCDELDVDAMPTPVVLKLDVIKPAGDPKFTSPADFTNPLHTPDPMLNCQVLGNIDEPYLCNTSDLDMFRAIPQPLEVAHPPGAIYAFDPSNSALTGTCNGNTWEAEPYVGEGWACLAVRAEDAIGNVGISAPLRVCFNDPSTAFVPDCDPTSNPPPDCTDGCALPDQFAPNMTIRQR